MISLGIGLTSTAVTGGGGGGGGTQIFNANVPNLNGTSMSFSPTVSTALNPRLEDWSIIASIKTTSTDFDFLITKAGQQVLHNYYLALNGGKAFIQLADGAGNYVNWSSNTVVNDGVEHTIIIDIVRDTVLGTGSISSTIDGVVDNGSYVKLNENLIWSGDYNNTQTFYLGQRDIVTLENWYTGAIYGAYVAIGASMIPYKDEISTGGVPRCFDIWSAEAQALVTRGWGLENHTGHTGQELIEVTGSGDDLNNNGTTPFTGSAQIECEA